MDRINGDISKYVKVKEELYVLASELITNEYQFNTALELIGRSAFVGEEANQVIQDHQIIPEEIHKK